MKEGKSISLFLGERNRDTWNFMFIVDTIICMHKYNEMKQHNWADWSHLQLCLSVDSKF